MPEGAGQFFHLVFQAVMAESSLAVIGKTHTERPVVGRRYGDDAGKVFRYRAGKQFNQFHGRFQFPDADAVAEFAGTGRPERDGGHALFPDIRHVDLLHAGEDDAFLVCQSAVRGISRVNSQFRAVNPGHGYARVNVHQQRGVGGYLAFDGSPADGGTFFQALLQLRGVYGKNVVLRPYAHNGKGLLKVENAVAFQGDGVDGKPVVFEDVIFPEKNDSPD